MDLESKTGYTDAQPVFDVYTEVYSIPANIIRFGGAG
jgi:hypothetical protein